MSTKEINELKEEVRNLQEKLSSLSTEELNSVLNLSDNDLEKVTGGRGGDIN